MSQFVQITVAQRTNFGAILSERCWRSVAALKDNFTMLLDGFVDRPMSHASAPAISPRPTLACDQSKRRGKCGAVVVGCSEIHPDSILKKAQKRSRKTPYNANGVYRFRNQRTIRLILFVKCYYRDAESQMFASVILWTGGMPTK